METADLSEERAVDILRYIHTFWTILKSLKYKTREDQHVAGGWVCCDLEHAGFAAHGLGPCDLGPCGMALGRSPDKPAHVLKSLAINGLYVTCI